MGPAGPIGPQGAPGVSGYEIVQASSPHANNIAVGQTLSARAQCPAGKRVLTGGVQTVNANRVLTVTSSYPDTNQSWFGEARNSSLTANGAADVIVFAICATVQ
jgi:hypothetical protein